VYFLFLGTPPQPDHLKFIQVNCILQFLAHRHKPTISSELSQVSMLDILCNLNNEVKIKIVCFLHPTKCLNMYDMLLLIFGGRVFWGTVLGTQTQTNYTFPLQVCTQKHKYKLSPWSICYMYISGYNLYWLRHMVQKYL
jgi:hypothetical protein